MEDISDRVVWEVFLSCDLREKTEKARKSWSKTVPERENHKGLESNHDTILSETEC